ncbi:MAG: FHA domain-containing protein [Lachnospiraceae bacterium]|nr:FHA domain-containing protein [Lachnospiraceae bacterium]
MERRKGFGKFRITVSLLTAALLWCGSVLAGQTAGLNAFLQGYRAEEGKVIVYCGNLAGNVEGEIAKEMFTATISGQEAAVSELSTVGEMQEGITFYCLVDVSGSMDNSQMGQAKDVLYAICDGLGEKDNMVVGRLGTSLVTTEFLTDQEEIRASIDSLVADNDYTALYDAVIDSISALQSNKSCNPRKCLVLISDGDNKTVIGKTQKEALDAVEESGIPVYTVAALRSSYTRQQIEYAENLGIFARQSVGGKDYVPRVDKTEAGEVGEDILLDNRSGQVLILDISNVEAGREEVLLSVQFDTGTDVYTDTMYLYAADLKPAPAQEPEPEESEESEPSEESGEESGEESAEEEEPGTEESSEEPTEDGEPEGLPMNLILLGGGALVLVIILIVVIVAVSSGKKKKKRALEEEQARAAALEEEQRRAQLEAEAQAQAQAAASQPVPAEPVPEPVVPEKKEFTGPAYEVKFIAVGYDNIVFTLRIPVDKTVTIGRNSRADLVLNPEDRRLSSVHFRVRCMQGVMNVWDAESQNGTFVNGVPIKQIGMATVQNGDLLRVGGYEYRVFLSSAHTA